MQIGFSGQGWVIAQPSEIDLATMNASGGQVGTQSTVGGALGGLLGR